MPEKDYKYLKFVEVIPKTPRKTKIFECRNKHHDHVLGEIKWYGPWRQYCYFPTVAAVYSAGCLDDIADFMKGLKKNG